MRVQTELFPQSTGFRPHPKYEGPILWIHELRVYRRLVPGDSNLLRAITLRPGLNILWARPAEATRVPQLHTPGMAGHGTGKTTFCRFLRHLLGEPSFGTDEQRFRLREAFPEGWIVAEVHVAGEPWIVARPFKVGLHPFAYRNRTLDGLFESEEGKVGFETFLAALESNLIHPLPVVSFATSPEPIRWLHLLQWLSRDQDCRFGGVAEMRHANSDSSCPDMAVEDRHFLFRAVLHLIDTAEQGELENNKALLARRTRLEKLAPLLRFRADSALKRWRGQFPSFRTDLDGASFLIELARSRLSAAEAVENELGAMGEPAALFDARERLAKLQSDLATLIKQAGESADTKAWIEQQLAAARGEKTQADLEEFARTHFQSDRYCNQPISTAIEWGCPLAKGKLLPIEKNADVRATPDEALLQYQIQREIAKQAQLAQEIAGFESRQTSAQGEVHRETVKFDQARGALAAQIAQARSVSADAERAAADLTEAERMDEAIVELDDQIRLSQEKQAALREQRNAALSALSDVFRRICHAVLGPDVVGTIRFKGRQICPNFEQGIDLSSAALETLKIICFDLAALIGSVEGTGAHPRFLLHDGPREADMDASLYHRLFLLMAELETAFGERPISFQYIVTTTEPPPATLLKVPWLCEPILSASDPSGKLLQQDF